MLLLTFSISTKFATALLIPIWLILAAQLLIPQIFSFNARISYFISRLVKNWPLLASLLMFLPLLLPRSQQFHPWYLIWPLVWLPLLPVNRVSIFWQKALLVLSVSSLYRYLPYLWRGEYTSQVIWQQQLITWIPLSIFLGWVFISSLISRFRVQ